MPNLVHSLDSTSLFLLFTSFFKSSSKNKQKNFYSVHDCYGVSVTDIDLLISLLRNVYIDLYSNKKYIEDFDKDIRDVFIKSLSTKDSKNEDVFLDNEKRAIYRNKELLIKLPKLPTNTELNEKEKLKYFRKLKKSILLIS